MNIKAVKHAFKETWNALLGIMLVMGFIVLIVGFVLIMLSHPVTVIGTIVGAILLAVFLNEYWEYDISHQRKDDRED